MLYRFYAKGPYYHGAVQAVDKAHRARVRHDAKVLTLTHRKVLDDLREAHETYSHFFEQEDCDVCRATLLIKHWITRTFCLQSTKS